MSHYQLYMSSSIPPTVLLDQNDDIYCLSVASLAVLGLLASMACKVRNSGLSLWLHFEAGARVSHPCRLVWEHNPTAGVS